MALPRDTDLEQLLQEFVCVRMVQINDLDLSLFQFDFELTWAAFVLNADRTLYGRYGTRSHNDRKRNVFYDRSKKNVARDASPRDMSIAGFQASLRAALALHARYVAEQDEAWQRLRDGLAQKTGEPWPWKTPGDMPGIRRQCTHCHQVPSNRILNARHTDGAPSDRILWSFPMPDLLGITLDPDRAATVRTVQSNSEGAEARIRPGDEILQIGDQPVISPADVQWALQHATDGEALPVRVRRRSDDGDRELDLALSLPDGWRRRGSFSWRWRSMRETLSRVLDGEAWHCGDLTPERRQELGIGPKGLGVEILGNTRRHGEQILHAGDVILRVDGVDHIGSASEFLAYVLQEKARRSELQLEVLRRARRIAVTVRVTR